MKRMTFPRNAVLLRLQILPSRSVVVHHDRCLGPVWCAQLLRRSPRRRAELSSLHSSSSAILLARRSFLSPRRRIIHSNTTFWKSYIIRSGQDNFRALSSSSIKKEKEQEEEKRRRQFSGHWWHQLKSPPNIITTARILSTPLLAHLIISHNYELALCGCLAAGLSDVLDGHLAKHYNMATVLGSYLDPLADKLLINVLSLSLWHVDILPTPLILLWLARDVGLTVATYLLVRSQTRSGDVVVDPVTTPLKVEPTTISKINTSLQFLTILLGLLQPLDHDYYHYLSLVPPEALEITCYITGVTTIASGYSYIGGASLTASGNNSNTIQSSFLKQEIATLKRQAKASGTKIRDEIQTKMANLSKTKVRSPGVRPKRKR